MNRSQAAGWSTFAALVGAASLAYLLSSVAPLHPDGSFRLPALVGFFAGALLLVGGMGTALALVLHERFPALAGVDPRRPGDGAAPEAAVRQGILSGATAAVLLLLGLFDLLDIAFVIVVLLLAGMVEAFWQNRPHRA